MEARYKQATELSASLKRITSLDGHVRPHWIPNTSCFWYRKDAPDKSFTFQVVNAETAQKGPMFDHEALAKALDEHNIKASATKLPFRQIGVDSNFSLFRFRINDNLWLYDHKSNTLTAPSVEQEGPNDLIFLKPLEQETVLVSKSSTFRCKLIFFNLRSKAVRLWWINYDGEPQLPEVVNPGKSIKKQSFQGHLWRVYDGETGDEIASYVTPDHRAAIATIDEDTGTVSQRLFKAELDPWPRCIVGNFNVYLATTGQPDVELSLFGSKDAPFDPNHVYPSGDGQYACVWQYTPQEDRKLYQIKYAPQNQLRPRLHEMQYLIPGDQIRIDRPRIFDLIQKAEVPTNDTLFRNALALRNIGWSPDHQKYRFISVARGHKVMRVIEIDIKGNVRTLVEERQSTFVDYQSKLHWRYFRDTDELVWSSERDGSNHLYLFKLNGDMTSDNRLAQLQLTSGACNVHHIEYADQKTRQVYVAMLGAVPGQDPYYMHLARVSMDHSGFSVLTAGDGNHSWTWNSDYKYFVDEWSRVDQAPQTVLQDRAGNVVLEIANGSLERLLSKGWQAPERFCAPGRDGSTPIYGIIIKPTDFSPTKRYPVVEHIYAGPQNFSVPKSCSTLEGMYAWAEVGFIIVQVDGMGTNWRCRTFHEKCYQNLRDAGLPDHIAWLRAAAKTRPWMDLSRVGIFGKSAGGQNAMSALLWHGDFYKAAIADSGSHDMRLYKLWWAELWMGWPVGEEYKENSNVVNAHRLTGALMLMVGALDDNVDPACTLRLVQALNEAGKDYELVYVPSGGHGVGDSTTYLIRRQWDFFVKHLLGSETPKWNTPEVRERMSILY